MTSLPAELAGGAIALALADKQWSEALERALAHGVPAGLDDAPTPAFTLDVYAMLRNIRSMHEWVRSRGADIAPHGKTTMAPALWRWQVAEGAWAITVANEFQARVAHAEGIRRVVLANQLVSRSGLTWIAEALADDGFELICWVDSVEAVALMDAVLDDVGSRVRLDVCVELGATGARGGVRTDAELDGVVDAVQASSHLRLRGLAGFEGAIKEDTPEATERRIRTFLTWLAESFERVTASAEVEEPIVSAGGSLYFDLVLDALIPAARRRAGARVVVRSGAYIVHDDDFYREGTPARVRTGPPLEAAAHIWAEVISTPEPGLALLDAGKRDLPYDVHLPELQRAWRGGVEMTPVTGRVTKLADQHAFVASDDLRVGDRVRLGISHPCTAFDKWRSALLTDDATPPHVLGAIATAF